jgi:hypothetical protein
MGHTQTITNDATETEVAYHYDRSARPAINVKVYARFDSDVRRRLEAALDPSESTIDTRSKRMVKDAAEKFGLDVDTLYEQSFEDLQQQWWDEAEQKAKTLGLGPIEAEGRSGGWLVFTDGRDPQNMLRGEIEQGIVERFPTEFELGIAESDGNVGMTYDDDDRRAWLTGYRAMVEWCAQSIRDYSADLDRAAVQLALGVTQSAFEPEQTALDADEFATYAQWAHDAGDDPTLLDPDVPRSVDSRIERIVRAVWTAVGAQHERTADLLVDTIEEAAGPEIMAAIEARENELLEWAGVPEFPEDEPDPSYGPTFFDADEIARVNSLDEKGDR